MTQTLAGTIIDQLKAFLCGTGFHKDPGPILGTGGYGCRRGPCKRCGKQVTVWFD